MYYGMDDEEEPRLVYTEREINHMQTAWFFIGAGFMSAVGLIFFFIEKGL